jgi:hypothetical protein
MVFVNAMESVYCAVRSESLYETRFFFKGLIITMLLDSIEFTVLTGGVFFESVLKNVL